MRIKYEEKCTAWKRAYHFNRIYDSKDNNLGHTCVFMFRAIYMTTVPKS